MEEILLYFAIKYNGDWDEIYKAINKKERVDKKDLDNLKETFKGKYITLLSDNYPLRLKNIYKPPFVLFYEGDINLLNLPSKYIGVIGSRENSEYGKDITDKIVQDLVKENIAIVSGLAKGIDSIAHDSCLKMKGNTIAVLGNGLDVYYPAENKELQNKIFSNGLVISEYPYGVEASKNNFPNRNRIVAGISDGVLVTEANIKSGTMITVNRALELGKEVFCVPYLANSNSGCNNLIKDGARLVENAKEIIQEL